MLRNVTISNIMWWEQNLDMICLRNCVLFFEWTFSKSLVSKKLYESIDPTSMKTTHFHAFMYLLLTIKNKANILYTIEWKLCKYFIAIDFQSFCHLFMYMVSTIGTQVLHEIRTYQRMTIMLLKTKICRKINKPSNF